MSCRRAAALLLVGLTALAAPGRAAGHDAPQPQLEDEFIKGVFSPRFVPPPPGSYELPVIAKVGSFLLRDAAGRRVSTGAVMAGKVAVVSFVYTACADRLGCPLASAALRDVQTRLREAGLGREAVLLTVSFDAERDTPAQLSRYASAYDADPALWRFMVAPSGRVLDEMLRSYGQDRTPVYDDRGRFTGRYRHVLKVFLVDRAGQVRNVYSTGFLVPEVVVNDIKTVLAK